MSLAHQQTTREPHRWSRAEYERMAEAGVLDAQARLELIDGELVVYRDPSGDDFLSKQSVDRSGAVAPLAAPGSTVHVADLLP